jgi:DNA-binding CsgD family transcriptional regulator
LWLKQAEYMKNKIYCKTLTVPAVLWERFFSIAAGDREYGFIARSRQAVFLYTVIALLAGIPVVILGLGGPTEWFFDLLNAVCLVAALVLWLLYRRGRISISVALTVQLLLAQADISAEMIYCALHPSEYHLMLTVGNLVLAAVLVLFSVIAYMRVLPYILGGVTLAGYAVCMEMTGNMPLQNFFPVFLLCFLVLALLGNRLVHNFHRMEKENTILKEEEQEMLNMFRMNKKQFRAYVELVKGKQTDTGKISEILSFMSEPQRRQLMETVSGYMTLENSAMDDMERAFPELSKAEHELVRLILAGRKQSEVLVLTGKTRGNITSTRTHIRRKLGLQPEDDLKKFLRKRMEECEAAPTPAIGE